MKTTYEQVFMIDQDILTYVAYHNNKMMGHQGAKSSLLTSGISPKYKKSAKSGL